jgi:outer membrane protein assembly factor BamB
VTDEQLPPTILRMTIDLGDLTTVVPASAPEPALRGYPRSRQRLIQLIALVIIIVATTVSSARPFGTPPRPVASLPMAANPILLISGAHAIVADTALTNGRITSYALPGGAREWSASLAGTTGDADMFALGSTVVAVTQKPHTGGAAVTAFDLRTGRPVWQHSADIAFPAGHAVIEYVVATEPDREVIRSVDPATGTIRWSAELPSGCVNQIGSDRVGDGGALLETCAVAGTIQRLDLISGTIVARGTFVIPKSNDYSLPGPASVTFVGDVALVAQDSADRTWVSAFRAADLTPLWAQTPLAALATLQSCGQDLCIASADGRLNEVDPDTGEARRLGTDQPAIAYGADILVPGGTTMLIAPDSDGDVAGFAPTAHVAIAPSVPDGTAVRLLTGSAGDTWIGRIVRTGGTPAMRLLWELPGYGGGCVLAGRYLACSGPSRHVDLLRIPDGSRTG